LLSISGWIAVIAGPSPRWRKIVLALLALCIIGYVWTLQ
jgi:hypothetical protein